MIEEIKVLDHGYIKYIEHYGSDERIIEAARMSTGKGFLGWEPKPCREHENRANATKLDCKECVQGDIRLLKRLWTHKHTSPFEMAGLIIEVQAPIMVFREWHRHRTQSYNEFSARYSVLPDLFYIPSIERLMNSYQSKQNKQASEEGISEKEAEYIQYWIKESCIGNRINYDLLIDRGVAREIARLVIPVNQYSKMRASANLWNWTRFLRLRMHKDAQWEIRQYANQVAEILSQLFPRTMGLFGEEMAKENAQ